MTAGNIRLPSGNRPNTAGNIRSSGKAEKAANTVEKASNNVEFEPTTPLPDVHQRTVKNQHEKRLDEINLQLKRIRCQREELAGGPMTGKKEGIFTPKKENNPSALSSDER